MKINTLLLALFTGIATGAGARAQESEEAVASKFTTPVNPPPPANRPQTKFLMEAGLLFTTQLSEQTKLATSFLVGVNDYDFDAGGFGEPWGTVIFNRIGVQLSHILNDTWALRGGSVLMASRESGADWGDSLTGGGTFGADYKHSDTLFLSLGAGVVSQLEDDAEIIPMVAMNWKASDRWTIRLGAIPLSGGTGAGAEGEYKLNDAFNFGLGLMVSERRFRLDDSGPATDGVGEETNIPLHARLTWKVGDKTSLHFIAGVATNGELRVENQNGVLLAKQDYDPAPYLGLRALIRF